MTNARKDWVVVADGAHARFLIVEPRADAAQGSTPHLVENSHIDNPEHTVEGRRDSRKIKSGRDSGRGGIASRGFTDHRDPHDAEIVRRFAGRIAGQLSALDASSITLVAETRMLALLHAAVSPLAKSGAEIRELAHDYTWCETPELEKRLAANQLL